MKKMYKLLSLLLVAVMVIGMLPVYANAADEMSELNTAFAQSEDVYDVEPDTGDDGVYDIDPDTEAEDAALLEAAENAGLLKYLAISSTSADLTRLDGAKLLAALMGITPIEGATVDFVDCAGLTQEERELLAAIVETGVVRGTSAETFDPSGLLTRAALATMIYRALGEPVTERSESFADFPVWYVQSVVALQDLGIIEDETFDLMGNIILVRESLKWLVNARVFLLESVISGDVSGNKKVDTRDVIELLRAIANRATGELSELKRLAADVNGDGKISTRDAIGILQSIADNMV